MGGIGSGRRGGGPVVEDALALDLRRLRALGLVRPGARIAGVLRWSGADGALTGRLAFSSDLTDAGAGRLVLQLGERRQEIRIVATAQPYGGLRWWLTCPLAGTRHRVLHLPPGATTFASRRAHHLAHRSQRQSPVERAVARSIAARRHLGITDPDALTMPRVSRPRGMRRARYLRLLAEIAAARAVLTGHLAVAFGQSESG